MAADEGAKAHSAASAHDRLVFKPKEQTVDGITVLIDNYDSFTFNIVQYLCQLGTEVHVRCGIRSSTPTPGCWTCTLRETRRCSGTTKLPLKSLRS